MLDFDPIEFLEAADKCQEMGDKMEAAGLFGIELATEEGKLLVDGLRAIWNDGQRGVPFTRTHCLLVTFMHQNFDAVLAKEVEAQKTLGPMKDLKNPGVEEDPSLN